MRRNRAAKLGPRLRARQHRCCRCATTAARPGIRLAMTAEEAAPFMHAPDGPSLRSKRGVEQFRCTDDTRSRAIRRRGAPTSPPHAAITPDALNTGLRQCQSESTNPVAIGSTGVPTRSGGDLLQIATGRFREAGESTVKNHIAGGRTNRSLRRPGRYGPAGAASRRAPLGPYHLACTPKTTTAATPQSAAH